MINLIIAATILIVVMLAFIFILFKNIIKRMDENAKKYFVNKMKDYDYILEEKQEKLQEINNKIKEVKEQNKNIVPILEEDDEEIEENKKIYDDEEDKEDDYIPMAKPVGQVKYNLNVPEYRETNFFANYKEVRKVFTVNNEKIIKDFVAKHKNVKEKRKYNVLKKLREKFDEETVYQCLTLAKEEQIKILEEALTDVEKKAVDFEERIKAEKFNVKDFCKKIDEELEQIDPTIYIYTNSTDNKYELIDKNIVMLKYCNMSEGIIIRYRNKVYDYSI